MRIRVLGSAAGGGFPQWNCGCDNCASARRARARSSARGRRSRSRSAVTANLVPAQRLAGDPRADRRLRWPLAARQAPFADRRHRPDQRRSRPLPRACCRCASRTRWWCTPPTRSARGFTEGNVLYRTLARFRRAGHLAAARARARRRCWATPAVGLRVDRGGAARQAALASRASRTPSAEDKIGLVIDDPRTGGRLAYFPGVAGPSPEIERAVGGAGRGLLRRHVLAQRRADRGWARHEARRGHGALAGRRRRGKPALLERSRRAPADPDPHQQHQSDPARGLSAERRAVDAAGVEVADDGLELTL